MGSKLEQLQGLSCKSELGFDSVSLVPVACVSCTRVHMYIHRHTLICLNRRLGKAELFGSKEEGKKIREHHVRRAFFIYEKGEKHLLKFCQWFISYFIRYVN